MIFSVQKPFSYGCMEVHGEFFLRVQFVFYIIFLLYDDALAHSGKSVGRFEISSFGKCLRFAWMDNGLKEESLLCNRLENIDLATFSFPR